MNIVLIGYRASGKSTIGKMLADRLSLEFADVDYGIMNRYDDRSVAEIWEEFGEPHYRKTECEVTEEACSRDGQVIALGGGTPMQQRAFDALQHASNTRRFYLKATADTLYRRSLMDTRNTLNRPTLTSIGGGLEEVRHMLEKREPTYLRLADHVVNVETQSLTDAADEIIRILSAGAY